MAGFLKGFFRLAACLMAASATCGADDASALKPFEAESPAAASISLKGKWRFKTDPGFKKGEDGAAHDDWEKPGFDDSSWGTMEVGKTWESQGLDYDGVAWLRQSVIVPAAWRGQPLGFRLGFPDDKAEVYINGKSFGSYDFGSQITLLPPEDAIRFGEPNCIAIRVRDWHKNGGLTGENISCDRAGGLKTPSESKIDSKRRRLDLSGLWRFLPSPEGNAPEGWTKPGFDDSSWNALYDNVSWTSAGIGLEKVGLYRQNVFVPEAWKGAPAFLRLGSIEAGDEAYFNGVRIGGIKGKYPFKNKKDRCYAVPQDAVNFGGMNCLAVKIDGSFSDLKKTCLSEKGVCLESDPDCLLMRWKGDPKSEIPAASFDVSPCQQGKELELLKPLPDGAEGQPECSLSDLYGNLVKAGPGRIEKGANGRSYCVLELDAAESRLLYHRGAFEIKIKLPGNGRKPFGVAEKVGPLDYRGRDVKELPPLEARIDETPYGKLKLIDEIDPSVPVESDAHPYVESGLDKSLAHNSPGSPVDVSVKEILGRKCREVSDGWFAYRIGRGKLLPHKEYLVRIEYPEDTQRYACVEMQTGFNYMDVGWKSGLGPDDPYDNYPLSNSFQSFDCIVLTDDRTYGSGGTESAPPDFGFWIFFMDKGRKSCPQYKAGPAVASIKLYEIDWKKNSPIIVKPDGAPERILMVDWERQPQNSPWDMVRYCKLMGYNAVSPCILKWQLGAYFPAGNAYNRHRASERDIYPQYLDACLKSGVKLIPRLEYGGSLNLPEEAKSIGPDGNYAKPSRYGDWGANILHPATWDDFSALVDELIAAHKDNPQLAGILWRVRCDRIQPSYSRRDVELFCKETGAAAPSAKSDKDLAKWASSGQAGKAYEAWWQKKLFEFHKRLRDKLASVRPGMKLCYYHWDSDKFSLGPYDWFSAKNWAEVSKKGGEAVYAEHLKKRSALKGRDYVDMIRRGIVGYSLKDCVHLALNCELYRNEKGILLFAPANYRHLSDCPEYLNYFRTAEGSAVSDQITYNEHAGRSINPKYETNMVLPAGPAYSMANEVLACFNADPVVLTYTSYTYGRGFADAHRSFAKAFLSLPAVEGKELPSAASPASPDLKARLYESPSAAYLGIVNKGFKELDCSFSVPGEWKGAATVHDFVDECDIPAKLENGSLVFKAKMRPMELRGFKIPK